MKPAGARWIAGLIILLLIALQTQAQAPAVVEQPRAFGYVLGDLVTQRVLLPDGFEPAELPRSERFGVWLERHASRIERGADGRRWLIVQYQIVNSPQSLTTVTIPTWRVPAVRGGDGLLVDAWPISVGPLTPRAAFSTGALQELQPDREAPLVATAPIVRQLIFWLSLLALTIVAWAAWVVWRNWRASRNQPFARALREIRAAGESAPQAWQALHAAFDRTAGRVVQLQTLPVLFERAPFLAPQRTEIEKFFAQSTERFYGSGVVAEPVSVGALCTRLRRAERRNER
jgi:mxaA protein